MCAYGDCWNFPWLGFCYGTLRYKGRMFNPIPSQAESLSIDLEFTDQELGDLYAATKIAGFQSRDAFIRAATMHATRSRRIGQAA
jgi:hypothetical protein